MLRCTSREMPVERMLNVFTNSPSATIIVGCAFAGSHAVAPLAGSSSIA
jgi:hypothetical protein